MSQQLLERLSPVSRDGFSLFLLTTFLHLCFLLGVLYILNIQPSSPAATLQVGRNHQRERDLLLVPNMFSNWYGI